MATGNSRPVPAITRHREAGFDAAFDQVGGQVRDGAVQLLEREPAAAALDRDRGTPARRRSRDELSQRGSQRVTTHPNAPSTTAYSRPR